MDIEKKYLMNERTEIGKNVEENVIESIEDLTRILDFVFEGIDAGQIDKVMGNRFMAEIKNAIKFLDRALSIANRM